MPALAGVAFDGSPWVTAASSVALVVSTGGFVMGGAYLMAKRFSSGSMVLPSDESMVTGRRVQPLQKSSSSSEQPGIQPPPRAESVDVSE